MVNTVPITRALDEESIKIMEEKAEKENVSQSEWLRNIIKKQK